MNPDDSVSINWSFINDSTARGAQVILRPEILNELNCENSVIRNVPNSVSSIIRKIPRGRYTINIYTLNRDGVPDSPAKSATTGMNISISSDTGYYLVLA